MNADDFLATLGEPELDYQDGYYIGIMSGTSLDGVDAALCRFFTDLPNDFTEQTTSYKQAASHKKDASIYNDETAPSSHGKKIELIATHSLDFTPALRQTLLALCMPNGTDALTPSMSELDWFGRASREYGELISELVGELLAKTTLGADDIIAIGCHGQTVRHRPEQGFSLQLIDPNVIAERTGITVVSDFRRRDMAANGQGAPLVPAFHQAIFGRQAHTQVVLNLGGIANITVLPPKDSTDTVMGYDTGVANLLMDGWIHRHEQKNFDKDGAWAKSGTVHEALLAKLCAHPFLAQTAPKSTGREDFNLAWLDDVLATLAPIAPADVQATLCEFTAKTAAEQIVKFAQADDAPTLYLCGGGAYNTHLATRFAHYLPNWHIDTTAALGLSPTWVEACAFAWLARQNILMQTGNLPAVTGAAHGVVLGMVCFA
ncbi:anhydro-N-acetylmuramic acid kinase [Moraxella caviae]|uniref:Anhydro-N-acetylmuramic acid kinase n=1 Tax=Moraxella caviae TaxID=34060 RepID=A0A1S9ZXL5_9GAMM|nr:anhydro-N-acetylmuramic acid kinase [Moraxella caviae]OOR88147.1 anhydro-N-acetylmuramic acid kinase [Moraxella caviae]STZ10500.1 Anhydro-N-acetylmuramic acid kinase [Moraxella caviae]VEW13094.1 Anhydro-N-acetylmuramic acid kinase [Moraxella caviae]